MSEVEARVIELEVIAAHQEQSIAELNRSLTEANKLIGVLERRIERAEDTLKEVLAGAQPLPNERPPHY
jgi:uncharacterized coiled-coil protein SlyX